MQAVLGGAAVSGKLKRVLLLAVAGLLLFAAMEHAAPNYDPLWRWRVLRKDWRP